METKVNATGSANSTNAKDVNPLANKVIAETSKQAQKILGKGKGTAKDAAKKADKAKAKAAPKTAVKKEPKVTVASKCDEIIAKGGKWEDLVAAANKVSKDLGSTMKFNTGVIKAHIRFREKKNPHYLGNLKITETGLFAKKAP